MAFKNRRKSKSKALINLAEITANILLKSNQSLNSHNNETKQNSRGFDSIINFLEQKNTVPQKIDTKNLYKKIFSRKNSLDVCLDKICIELLSVKD